MSFADKKGITVASGFKLQAESPIDARFVVDTIAERDELVSIKAAYPGLDVFVKATKKKYMYNGTGWTEVGSGAAVIMTGATASAAGTAGYVPAPQITERNKFLRGDGTWVPAANNFVGATASTAGISGLVPAATAGANNLLLCSDGTWAQPMTTAEIDAICV